MSSLTVEQLAELTERINARFAEFDVDGMRVFESVTCGVARLVFDVVEEWQCSKPVPMVELSSPGLSNIDMMDGYHVGYQRGRESMRAELGMLEKAGGWVGTHNIDPGIEMNVERHLKPLAETHADAPTLHIKGNDYLATGTTNIDQIRADAHELGEHWPTLDGEPNGADIFAGVHPVAGAPEPEPITPKINVQCEPDVIEALPAPKPTNGNGHHATLGPEHTIVTPLVPRRAPELDPRVTPVVATQPRTLDEADAGALSGARMSKDERAADLRATIHALQDMAKGGEMPTMNDWLLNRPDGFLTAQGIMGRHNMTWAQLAEYAKLKLKGTRGKGIGR